MMPYGISEIHPTGSRVSEIYFISKIHFVSEICVF